jgi:hypothetical protein
MRSAPAAAAAGGPSAKDAMGTNGMAPAPVQAVPVAVGGPGGSAYMVPAAPTMMPVQVAYPGAVRGAGMYPMQVGVRAGGVLWPWPEPTPAVAGAHTCCGQNPPLPWLEPVGPCCTQGAGRPVSRNQ